MSQTLKEWCIENSKEDLLKQWDYEKNAPLTPEQVSTGTTKKVWWRCSKGHSWQTTVYSRSNGTGCPYCSGRLPIVGENDLATTHPHLISEWNTVKNGDLNPTQVKMGTHKKVWWICSVCGYEWEAVISSRAQGYGCPQCARKKISQSRRSPKQGHSLMEKFPEIAAEWDYSKNGILTPNDISYKSSQLVYWKCKKGHSWRAAVRNRTGGRGCPVCANKKIKRGINDLATLNPELAKEWHPTKNEPLSAFDVAPSSNKRVWWKCSKCGHEWDATINNRTKRGCPKCSKGIRVSFPEKAIAFYLRQAGLEIKENYRPEWLDKKELDVYIPSIRLGIEYDGERWHKKDGVNKDILCLKNAVGLIHIREPNCQKIGGVRCYNLQDRKESSLNQAIEFIYEILQDEYNIYISPEIKIDVAKNRSQIYELLAGGKKENSLRITHPQLSLEWHPTKNGILTPDMVSRGSDKVVWWQCEKGHEWNTSISHRVRGNSCPICSGKRVIEGQNDIATLYPDLMKDWDWEKNKNIIPEKCGKNCAKRVWWKCHKCGYSWQLSILSRINESKCPNCKK